MMQEISLNPGSLKADSQGFQINWPQTIAASAELKKTLLTSQFCLQPPVQAVLSPRGSSGLENRN